MFEWIHGWFTPSEKKINKTIVNNALGTMTKKQLEVLGREHGIELDLRFKRQTLIKQLKKNIK
jgi:hypothetical protein|tara:strand:- start:545 stop:733 length:189 start_codon:yes stop_codon:yes gene_type:complete